VCGSRAHFSHVVLEACCSKPAFSLLRALSRALFWTDTTGSKTMIFFADDENYFMMNVLCNSFSSLFNPSVLFIVPP
jgi:hypothetical protein